MENRSKLESLTLDTVKLKIELDGIWGTAHEMKASRYDFEQGVRYQLESEIATMRRELFSIQSKLGTSSTDTSVSMIEGDTVKSFNIASALNKIRAEYEKSLQHHREKADAYYKIKMEEVQATNATSSEALTTSKAEISASRKELQAPSLVLQSLVNMNMSLERSFAEAHAQSSGGVAEYQAQIRSLEGAIEVAKEPLDAKLALDAEITTYRTLLDWDDLRLEC
ncbi:unnamed protein product [Coregonus sp. 'balchen']|nr:unnamed protein product [Coregonus sp. 'balchen']